MFRVNGLHASSVGISSSGFFIKYRIYPGKKLRDSEESAVSHIVGVESYEQIYTVDYAGKKPKNGPNHDFECKICPKVFMF